MVMATIVDKKGSAPRGVGAKALFLRDGSFIGTIGGGKPNMISLLRWMKY